MPRPPYRYFLSLLLASTGLVAQTTKILLEAEDFGEPGGKVLKESGIRFVRLPEKVSLRGKLRDVFDDGEFVFLLRMRYPRVTAVKGMAAAVTFSFGDEEQILKTNTAGSWRWLNLGRFKIKEFETRKIGISGSAAFDMDKLVLWSGKDYAGEGWYRLGVSALWAKGKPAQRVFEVADERVTIEAESAGVLRGAKKPVGEKPIAVSMSSESSEISFLLDVVRDADFQLLAKTFHDGDDLFRAEGPVFVFIDGGLFGRLGLGENDRWIWQRVGPRVSLAKGIHLLSLHSGRTRLAIDQLVLYGGGPKEIVMEDWYRELKSPLYRQKARPEWTLKKGQETLALEAEEMEEIQATTMRDAASGGRAVVFRKGGSVVNGLISVETQTSVRAYARVYFDLENTIAGDANSLFLGFDEEGFRQLSSGVYDRYHWLATPKVSLLPGTHLVSLRSRELPVRIDKVVLFAGDDATGEPWLAETYPEPMPFGLANTLKRSDAKQVQNWLVFGDLADTGQVALTHEVARDQYYSLAVKLGEGGNGKHLILRRRGHAVLRTYPAFADRNRKQQVDMWVHGDLSACEILGVTVDAAGKEFMAPFACRTELKGWRRMTMNVGPSEPAGALLRQPQYPVTFKYIVFRKTDAKPSTLHLEEPEFVRYLEFTASYADGRVNFVIQNGSPDERTISAAGSLLSFADWQKGKPLPTHWDTAEATVPASGRSNCPVQLTQPVDGGRSALRQLPAGLWCVLCRLGAGVSTPRFVAVGAKAKRDLAAWLAATEKKLGCFHLGAPMKQKNGAQISREQVRALYSRPAGFRILVDGIDACSRKYATQTGNERLLPLGRDLSDAKGWPFIRVPPGTLAIDPVAGRFKFSEGDADPPRLAGRFNTGFGVPGSGRIAVKGDFAFVPAGEGDMTIVNCSDPRNPKVAAILPSYHFTHSVVFSGDKAYMDAKAGGVVLIDDLSDPEHPGPIRQIPWKWGRGVPALHREAKLMYVPSADHIKLIDISEPDAPTEIGQQKLSKEIHRFVMSPDGRFAYTLVDDAAKIGVISLENPRKPRLVSSVLNVSLSNLKPKKTKTEEEELLEPDEPTEEADEPKGIELDLSKEVKDLEKKFDTEAMAGIAAVGKTKLAMRLGDTFIVYGITDPTRPKRGKHYTFKETRMVIRDVALKGSYLYVIDGRQKGSQHSLNLGSPRSRLFVVDFTGRSIPKLVARYEDPNITEYSNLTIKDNLAYVNDYNYGLWLFDVSDPRKPVKLGGTATAGEGHWSLAHGNYAFIAQTFGGSVIIIDVTDPTKPKRCGTYWDGMWNNYHARLAASARSLYVPKPSNLIIVDFSDPYHPRKVGEFLDKKGRPLKDAKIVVEDSRAYVASLQDGKPILSVYDLKDASKPVLTGTLKLYERPIRFRLAKDGTSLFAAGDFGRYLVAIDVSDPNAPIILSKYSAEKIGYGEKKFGFTKEGGWNGGVSACRGFVYVTIGAHPPGEPVTFRDVVQHALTIYRDISILLASLSPVSLFLAKTIVQPHDRDLNEYPFFLGLNVFFIATCGTVALIRRASDLLNNCNVKHRQSVLIILSWLAISLFAGGQCAWYLRPYFGVSTIKDIPFIEGSRPDYRGARSFYEAVYHLMDPPPLPEDYRNYLQGH